MSRQRIRASVLESSTEPCPQCGGSGHVRSVSSVALQLLRGIEEILMKGATHNLVVRTRTDVALYVLNHKRGHLRDLENAFKVTLAVVADPTVSGQQSFIIDRGEQVHTLEAAKALLAAQAAASPPQVEEAYDDEEPFDIEARSRNRRDRRADRRGRRRRRSRAGESEARRPSPQAAPAPARPLASRAKAARRATTMTPCALRPKPVEGAVADDGEADDEEGDEQPGVGRAANRDRTASGARAVADVAADAAGVAADRKMVSPDRSPTNSDRPRLPEATNAVADFDGGSPEPAPTLVRARTGCADAATAMAARGTCCSRRPVSSAPAPEETAAGGRPGRRAAAFDRARKGLFMTSAQPEAGAVRQPKRSPSRRLRPAPAEPAPAAADEAAAAQGRLVVAAFR